MILKSKVFSAAAAFILMSVANGFVYADTIKLKDGSIIKGKIVEFKNQQITLVRSGANNRNSQITIETDDIAAVEFDSIDNLTALINVARDNAQTTSAVAARSTSEPGALVNNNRSNASEQSINSIASAQTTAPNGETSAATSIVPVNRVPATITNQPGGGLSQVINSQPVNAARSNNGRYVPFNVKVLADNTANGWTNTGVVVKKGQRIRISASGRVSLGKGQYTTPAGLGSIPDGQRLMKTEPTGALIAVIGDDNNDFVFVGSISEFLAPRDGTLFLGVNEGNLEDNSGAFDAVVEAEASDTNAGR